MSVQSTIESKLQEQYSPAFLEVVNESHMHSVPPNSETHFKVTLVSETFAGTRRVQRHQTVYKTLADELEGGVHALALHLYDPEEWQGVSPDSPLCRGGSKQT